jgi:MATE family multidrug resistance protein
MGAVNRPEPGLWITLVAIPVNAFLAYALIHGEFGMPRLDLLGAGIATTLVNVGMCAVAIWVCYARHPFKKVPVLGRFWRADWQLLEPAVRDRFSDLGRLHARMGFVLLGRDPGRLDRHDGACAHQIALQVASILFMVPFGISLAATVRVGHAVGAAIRSRAGARASPRSGWARSAWR